MTKVQSKVFHEQVSQMVNAYQQDGTEQTFNNIYQMMLMTVEATAWRHYKNNPMLPQDVEDFKSVGLEALINAVEAYEHKEGRNTFVALYLDIFDKAVTHQLIRPFNAEKRQADREAMYNSLNVPKHGEEGETEEVMDVIKGNSLEEDIAVEKQADVFEQLDALIKGFEQEEKEIYSSMLRELFSFTIANPDAMEKQVNRHLEASLGLAGATMRSRKDRAIKKFREYCSEKGFSFDSLQQI